MIMIIIGIYGKGVERVECINCIIVDPGFPGGRSRIPHMVVVVKVPQDNNIVIRLLEKGKVEEIGVEYVVWCLGSRRCTDSTHFKQNFIFGVDRTN